MICSEHKEKCRRFPQACPNNCGQDIPREEVDDHKKVCPLEMIQCEYQCGARIARKEVEKHNLEMMTKHIQLAHNVLSEMKIVQSVKNEAKQSVYSIATSLIGPHFTTVLVVLCVVIAALLLQPYYTTTDHDLIIKEVQNSIGSMKAQNHEELTKASSLVIQLQNDVKDLKFKETECLEKLTQSELLVKQLQDDKKYLKFKETECLEKLTQSELLVKQLQNDVKDLKFKEAERLEKLTQSELLVNQLQNDNKDLKAKHSVELTKSDNCKMDKLTQTESKLSQLLSLSESVYISYNSNHGDKSLWPLILSCQMKYLIK